MGSSCVIDIHNIGIDGEVNREYAGEKMFIGQERITKLQMGYTGHWYWATWSWIDW